MGLRARRNHVDATGSEAQRTSDSETPWRRRMVYSVVKERRTARAVRVPMYQIDPAFSRSIFGPRSRILEYRPVWDFTLNTVADPGLTTINSYVWCSPISRKV